MTKLIASGATAARRDCRRCGGTHALSSVVLSTTASAGSVKLPTSGVENPSCGTVTETGSRLLSALQPLGGGYNQTYPN